MYDEIFYQADVTCQLACLGSFFAIYLHFSMFISMETRLLMECRSNYGFLVAVLARSHFRVVEIWISNLIFLTSVHTCTLDRKRQRLQITSYNNGICRFIFCNYFILF